MVSLNFENARVVQNDMVGPGKGALRFADLMDKVDGKAVDLKVEATTPYHIERKDHTGLHGKFGQINLLSGTSVGLKFTFVEAETNTPIVLESFHFSILDLDCATGEVEMVSLRDFDKYFLTDDTEVKVEAGGDGFPIFKATTPGVFEDNPTDPANLTAQQQRRTVTLEFSNLSSFSATFKIEAPGAAPLGEERRLAEDGVAYTQKEFITFFGQREGLRHWTSAPAQPRFGRNFLFAGTSQVVKQAQPQPSPVVSRSKPVEKQAQGVEEPAPETSKRDTPQAPVPVADAKLAAKEMKAERLPPPLVAEQVSPTHGDKAASQAQPPSALESALETPPAKGQKVETPPISPQKVERLAHYTVVWHWGYPKSADLADKAMYTPGPEWYIFHPDTLDEARAIYNSINSRLGHHENRASRAIFSPEGEVVDTWAFDHDWAENLKKFDELRQKGWQPHEEAGIWH